MVKKGPSRSRPRQIHTMDNRILCVIGLRQMGWRHAAQIIKLSGLEDDKQLYKDTLESDFEMIQASLKYGLPPGVYGILTEPVQCPRCHYKTVCAPCVPCTSDAGYADHIQPEKVTSVSTLKKHARKDNEITVEISRSHEYLLEVKDLEGEAMVCALADAVPSMRPAMDARIERMTQEIQRLKTERGLHNGHIP